MTRFRAALLVWLLAVAGLSCIAQAQLPLTGAGKGKPGVVVAYSGPVDAVAGATSCYAFRGCTAAYSTGSNPATDLCDVATQLVCSTINVLANGNYDKATADASAACAVSCFVAKFYDQLSGFNVQPATGSSVGPLYASGVLNSKSVMQCENNAARWLGAASTTTINQPFTISAVVRRLGAAGGNQTVFEATSTNVGLWFLGTASTWAMYGGNLVNVTASDGHFHSFQGIYNGASSVPYVDGVAGSTINVGTMAFATGWDMCRGVSVDGYIAEIILYPSGLNSTQAGALTTNQTNFWGPF